ncbi:histidinol-phosphate aminotransferase family protein [Aminithiophilus ramosus]|uniref:Histidinol-phosphate aminotransferase family protein n=1 Tax=Aminithiophilus ramosus TaxID=3029084 RepID=A0A9Q7A9H3_9BACT|nr:histidinol-phosphate transaminase [Aminithiophilus ramosus]QTX33000.1 histidinol-phosphate aminotransferase family protein [Aminithiophilus ramosus]
MSLHGGRIWERDDPRSWVDFSANINPWGPPLFAVKAARRALAWIDRYPDGESRSLREALERATGRDRRGIVVGNGAGDLIRALFASLRPRRFLTVEPTFAEYGDVARSLAIPVRAFPLDAAEGFAFPVEALCDVLDEGDLLLACQPNNPTGRAWTEGELECLLKAAEARGALLVVDECFLNLTVPAAATLFRHPWPKGLFLLRAFTKDFALPGLRVGYLLASEEAVGRVRAFLQPWPLNCVGEAAARACLEEGGPFLSRCRKRLASARQAFSEGLAARGFAVFPGAANYLLCRSPLDGKTLQERLVPSKILVRRCHTFPGLDDGFVRLAVRSEEENGRFIEALDALF